YSSFSRVRLHIPECKKIECRAFWCVSFPRLLLFLRFSHCLGRMLASITPHRPNGNFRHTANGCAIHLSMVTAPPRLWHMGSGLLPTNAFQPSVFRRPMKN